MLKRKEKEKVKKGIMATWRRKKIMNQALMRKNKSHSTSSNQRVGNLKQRSFIRSSLGLSLLQAAGAEKAHTKGKELTKNSLFGRVVWLLASR